MKALPRIAFATSVAFVGMGLLIPLSVEGLLVFLGIHLALVLWIWTLLKRDLGRLEELIAYERKVAELLGDNIARFQDIAASLTSGNDSSQLTAETRAASPAGAQKASKGGSAS